MLIATAEAASTEEGASFMEEFYPESYQNETGLRIAQTLQRLFTYTTDMRWIRILTCPMTISFQGRRR